MFCSRRNVNMASDVDFISMSRNGQLMDFVTHIDVQSKQFLCERNENILRDPSRGKRYGKLLSFDIHVFIVYK